MMIDSVTHERKSADAWEAATFEGARREQLRRWSKLSLEQIIRALEEMEELSERLTSSTD